VDRTGDRQVEAHEPAPFVPRRWRTVNIVEQAVKEGPARATIRGQSASAAA